MTNEEAIKILKANVMVACDTSDKVGYDTPLNKAIEQALEMSINALGKDIPKAPKKGDTPRYGMGYEYYDWYCPTCNKFLAFETDMKRHHIKRCKCGQKLDWGK